MKQAMDMAGNAHFKRRYRDDEYRHKPRKSFLRDLFD
jgi:hypothetical protein